MSTFCDIVCSPAMIGVEGFETIAFVANSCCDNGDAVNSKSLMDFTPTIFNPSAEAAISAFSTALSIAGLINEFLICSRLLIGNCEIYTVNVIGS